jgi:ferredoxin
MDIQAVKLACFSPTGTSKSIIQAVAQGIGHAKTELIDATRPAGREKQIAVSANELLVLAVPVYAGRVPGVLKGWLESIRADNSPVVCIVLYGNREFDDALLELTDIAKKQGGVPVAGAAFIGEHSFSSDEYPIAVARPDQRDLDIAEDFGRKAADKISGIASADQAAGLTVPGESPYKELPSLPPIDFIAVSEACTQCGICADDCPMEAIPVEDGTKTDKDKCIKCCACIKVCPEGARAMAPAPMVEKAKFLSENFAARKEPELFL